MQSPVRCKRIIGNEAYNTETSAFLGQSVRDGGHLTESLFQTRTGKFFLHVKHVNMDRPSIAPLPRDDAQTWMTKHAVKATVAAAEGRGAEVRFTARIPKALHDGIADAAERDKRSVNAWIVRALEKAVAHR